MILDKDNEKIMEFMRISIDAGKNSKPENEEHKPKVGAVVVKDGKILGTSYRGELGPGDHAEFTLLSKKLEGIDCSGGTLFTTLEPCTHRKTKKPCSHWIVEKQIKTVYIGMYDPNPLIFGQGYEYLKSNGVEVLNYPPQLTKEIEKDNFQFIQYCRLLNKEEIKSLEDLPYHLSPHYRSLDDWYRIINRIYFDKNFSKDTKLIFTHLVEILGGLSVLYTNKQKDIDPLNQMAKVLSWWLVLCGKMGIRSVQDMVYYKFPNVCPYCNEKPHNEDKCLHIKLENAKPNWDKLFELGKSNNSKRPSTLSSWQQMFYNIYPITMNDDYDKVLGRFTEEIGELAEAIRISKVAPSYFLSEASDVFAWLMHLFNLYESRTNPKIKLEERGKIFEDALFALYPDKCKDCNQQICGCPPILKSTIGRITNDGPDLDLFDKYNSPYLTKSEIAKEFDAGSSSIIIGNYQFDVTSKLIKTLYHFSNNLTKEIRYVQNTDSNKFDKIIDSLHIINAYSSTQRVNQNSIDKLLRYCLDLNTDDKEQMNVFLKRLDSNELKNALISVIK